MCLGYPSFGQLELSLAAIEHAETFLELFEAFLVLWAVDGAASEILRMSRIMEATRRNTCLKEKIRFNRTGKFPLACTGARIAATRSLGTSSMLLIIFDQKHLVPVPKEMLSLSFHIYGFSTSRKHLVLVWAMSIAVLHGGEGLFWK